MTGPGIRAVFTGIPIIISDGVMIIDCHGHYTTEPKDLLRWRKEQVDYLKDPAKQPPKSSLKVSDDEIESAMRAIYDDTHNVAEGAAAASVAALLQEKDRMKNSTVGVVLTGANVDRDLFIRILATG